MPKGRRVRRVVRKVDVASVLRLAAVFWVSVVLVTLLAGVVVWAAAGDLGVFTSMTKFMASLGVVNFRFHGGAVLQAATLLGLVFVAGATAFTVILAVLYNAVSAAVGGIELVVIEQEWANEGSAKVAAPGSVAVARSQLADGVPAVAVERAEPLTPGVAV